MIYLAAPLFTRAEYLFNEDLACDLLKNKWDVFLPQEECKKAVEIYNKINEKWASEPVFNVCKQGIFDSDIVVAILDGADADSGTCWEVGYAYALGKYIIGLRTDIRRSGDTGGFNLMLYNSCTVVIEGNDAMMQFWKHLATLKNKKAPD
jgi:nucleoside 2-deoxyribosyltransferase